MVSPVKQTTCLTAIAASPSPFPVEVWISKGGVAFHRSRNCTGYGTARGRLRVSGDHLHAEPPPIRFPPSCLWVRRPASGAAPQGCATSGEGKRDSAHWSGDQIR